MRNPVNVPRETLEIGLTKPAELVLYVPEDFRLIVQHPQLDRQQCDALVEVVVQFESHPGPFFFLRVDKFAAQFTDGPLSESQFTMSTIAPRMILEPSTSSTRPREWIHLDIAILKQDPIFE